MAHTCGVTETPEIKIVNFDSKIHRGLVLASDGVWEHVTNGNAAKIVEEYIESNHVNQAVDQIVIHAINKWKRVYKKDLHIFLII